jgi:hypothetical protein
MILSKRFFVRAVAAVVAAGSTAATAGRADAQVTTAAGYIYAPLLLGDLTQSCVQAGPGATFVGQGPGFTPGGQRIVLVTESGVAHEVASGFNSISDCIYDATTDVLYVTDNSGELEGAVTGDTVFAIPAASIAPGATAAGNELAAAGALPFAAGVTLDADGEVYVSSSAGGASGSVDRIDGGAIVAVVPGLDFASGIAFDANGELLVAESLDTFETRVTRWSPTGSFLGDVAGPGFDFGSYDLALDAQGRLILTGAYAGDVVTMNPGDGSTLPLVGGLTFTTGVDVDEFTGRISMLSSTFIPTSEDFSIHRLVDKSRLIGGKGSEKTECTSEIYGAELVPSSPGKKAKRAICVDGEACDADGTANDVCVFPLGVCLNVEDSRFTKCSPSGVAAFRLKKSKPESSEIADLAAAVAADVPIYGERCYFSDGMQVPVNVTGKGKRKTGKGKIKLEIQGAGEKPYTDTDKLKMRCRPAS